MADPNIDEAAVRAASANATVPFALQSKINPIRGSTEAGELKVVDFPGFDEYVCVGMFLNMDMSRVANADAPANTTVSEVLEYIRILKRIGSDRFDRIAHLPCERLPSLATMLCAQSPYAVNGYFGHKWFEDNAMADTNAAKHDRAQYVIPGAFGRGATRVAFKLHSLTDLFGSDVGATTFVMRVTPMYVHVSRLIGEAVTRYAGQYLSGTNKVEALGPSTTFGIAGKSRLSSIVAGWSQGSIQMESSLIDDLEDNFSWRIHDHVPAGSSWTGGINGLNDAGINANSHIAMSSIPGQQVDASVDFKSNQEILALHIGRSVEP